MDSKVIQKYNGRSVSWLLKKATYYFNAYIRERDKNLGCISCGTQNSSMFHAGHFFSAGHHPSVRFNEDNVHKQCVHCNTFLHGNLINYQERLIKKIGVNRFQDLSTKVKIYKRQVFKWDRLALIEIIETYKLKIKEL